MTKLTVHEIIHNTAVLAVTWQSSAPYFSCLYKQRGSYNNKLVITTLAKLFMHELESWPSYIGLQSRMNGRSKLPLFKRIGFICHHLAWSRTDW